MSLVHISTVTVGAGGAASIDFTSIPQTGTDLLVVLSSRVIVNSQDDAILIKLNGSTTGFSSKILIGNGSTVGSSSYTSNTLGYTSATYGTTNTFGSLQAYFCNYAGSSNKSYSVESVRENNATGSEQDLLASLWSNNAAITSITLYAASGNLQQYSTASLYMIQKGSGGANVA